VVLAQSAVWEQRIPRLDYDKANVLKIYQDLETLSKEVDPEKRGIRIITFRHPTNTYPLITLHLTNITFKFAARMISELGGLHVIFGDNNIYEFGWPFSGPPYYHRAGVIGRIVDAETGEIITNATLTSWPDPMKVCKSRIQYSVDGTFIAVIDYLIQRIFMDGFWVIQPEDYKFEVLVNASGYKEQKIIIDDTDKTDTGEVIIKIKKSQSTNAPYSSPSADLKR
jgi:hypothetical protein